MRIFPHNRLHVHAVPIALIAVLIIGVAAVVVSIAVYPKDDRLTWLGNGLTKRLVNIQTGKSGLAGFSFAQPEADETRGINGVDSLGGTSRHTFLIHGAAAEVAAKAEQAKANQQLLNKTSKNFRAR